VACGADGGEPQAGAGRSQSSDPPASSGEPESTLPDSLVRLPDGRAIHVTCFGSGSPTVVLESGDLDLGSSYAFAREPLGAVTRTCWYDRANLGTSDPAPAPRQLGDLVGDLGGWLDASGEPGPYVLVGTSGGGYITAGYAVQHRDQVAGMVFVEVPAPFKDPPQIIVEETDPDHPANAEKRDYLQVEKDAWAARRLVGDIPLVVISNRYSEEEIAESPFPSEQRGMRANVREQRGWFVLSSRAEQVVVTTGHAVEEADPQLVIDTILDVVTAARSAG